MEKIRQVTSDNVLDFASSFDTVLTDCDGVIWSEGEGALPGASETLNKLRSMGKKIFFVTNNSTKSRQQYLVKMEKLGFQCVQEEIVCTAYVAAAYLKHHLNYRGKVYLIGGQGLMEELDNHDLKYIGPGPDHLEGTSSDWMKWKLDPEVGAVLVGFDEHFSYSKLIKAASYLHQKGGCEFLATNTDGTLPTMGGQISIPGTGCFVYSVKAAAGREPEIVGKPHHHMFDVVKKRFPEIDPKRTVMIGDRLETDILMGHNSGLTTLMVLTGVSTLQQAQQFANSDKASDLSIVPDYYIQSLGHLGKLIDEMNIL